MKFKRINFIILIALKLQLFAQVTFTQKYPTVYDKTSREVLALSDGGYMIAGMTNNSNIVDADVYVMRTNGVGELLWSKIYGGSKPDYAYGMIETSDGNFFIVGYTQSFGGGDYDVYLLKIDPAGNIIWQKNLGGFGNEEGREIIKTNDGNYVIVGTTNSNTSSQNAFLMKVDLSGAVLWTKYYGGPDKEYGNSVQQFSDGSLILTGQTYSSGNGKGDVYLVKTNSNGDVIWSKTFGGVQDEEGVSVVANSDGSCVTVIRDSSGGRDIDIRVIKADIDGNIVWNKEYYGLAKDTPKRIRATKDGGYIIGAISRSFGWIYPDIWLLKLNAMGDTSWTKHIGWGNHEHCHDLKESAEGGYLVVGHTRSFGPAQQILFMKINDSGLVSLKKINDAENDWEVFPNPSTGEIQVNLKNHMVSDVHLLDALGKQCEVEVVCHATSKSLNLSLKNKKPGVYFLSIVTGEAVLKRKIIVN
jgi:hypothetical protein